MSKNYKPENNFFESMLLVMASYHTRFSRKFLFHTRFLIAIFSLSLLHPLNSAAAEQFRIATAANFRETLNIAVKLFAEKYPQYKPEIISASSGILYAQIVSGAPFDLFLSADDILTGELMKKGKGIAERTYAYGRLVLWVPAGSTDGRTIDSSFLLAYKGRLALANPATAPYGQAAEHVVNNIDVADNMTLVYGNNVIQAYQFIESGNVLAGLISWSLVHDRCNPNNCWLIPENRHPVIRQNMVLLTHNKAASEFFTWLNTEEVKKIISSRGYKSAAFIKPDTLTK